MLNPLLSNALRLRVTAALNDVVNQAAAARQMTVSAWLRHAARTCAALEGFDIPVSLRPCAGDPEWALVQMGDPSRIVRRWSGDDKPDLADASQHPAGYTPSAGDAWLPIEEADTEPFDPALHWRQVPPQYEIVWVYDRLDRVRRLYTVVPKSLEHA